MAIIDGDKIITLGYLDDDINLDINYHGEQYPSAYCPTYSELISDKFINYGHDFVEIGGVKWATMNIGANSITDTGLYFQWGDTSGYTAAQVDEGKKYFGWADYKYGNGTSSPGATGMTKYNSTDGKTVLDASDDAARANWGGSWRMPTTAEYAALGAAVNSAWTTDYQGSGVSGLVLTDKTDSSKVLFFPAAGYCIDGSVYSVGSYGDYWSSSVNSSNVRSAYLMNFSSSLVYWQNLNSRCYGFPVRAVTDSIIKINGTYKNNQLVRIKDLKVKSYYEIEAKNEDGEPVDLNNALECSSQSLQLIAKPQS